MTTYRPQVGDTVSGTYCGVTFTRARVESVRGHTLNWDVTLVTVRTAEPFDFHGSSRQDVSLWIDAGRPDRDTLTLIAREG